MSDKTKPPIPLEEMQRLCQENVWQIIYGLEKGIYSEWLLRGAPGEQYNPVALVAAFYAGKQTSIMIQQLATTKPVSYFQDQVLAATLPERVQAMEQAQYQQICPPFDQAIFHARATELALNLRPAGIVVFSQPTPTATESIYLYSDNLVHPSQTLLYVQQGLMPPEPRKGSRRVIH